MQATIIILSLFLLATLIAIVLLFRRLEDTKKKPESDTNFFLLLQQQMQELTRVMDHKMSETHKTMVETQENMQTSLHKQFGASMKIVTDVTEKLTKLDETNRQVVNFADQLQRLQDVLKNPKQRGILGEYYLETVLKNVLPPGSFQMQYSFADGDIVDAVVFVKEKIIPIDSKFSLENYNRIVEERDPVLREELQKKFKADLKLRIDETAKYIKPTEGTMDFAFMFIPAEGIYYDLLINKVGALSVNTQDLIEYAFNQRHVIIVSPTSFLAYLQTVLQGLRALQIEESAKDIRIQVGKLATHLGSYEEYLKKLGINLGTTVGMYNKAYAEFGKIDKDVVKIAGGERTVSAIEIERPTLE